MRLTAASLDLSDGADHLTVGETVDRIESLKKYVIPDDPSYMMSETYIFNTTRNAGEYFVNMIFGINRLSGFRHGVHHRDGHSNGNLRINYISCWRT